MSAIKIFSSSAGSGKTYRLALEYLKLALQDPHFKFRHILAVTFTNKATTEMKNRIIAFLKKVALHEDPGLMATLEAELNIEEQTLKQRATTLLSSILHNYSVFSISTIDAFYQRILRSFARETGLIGSFNLELDHQKVLDEVIDRMLDSLGENKPLTDWLVAYSFDSIKEGKNWDVRRELRRFAREIFTEAFRAHEQEFLEEENLNQALKEILDETSRIKSVYENQMKAYGDEAVRFIEKKGLVPSDFKRGVFTPFLKFREKDFTFTATLINCLQDKAQWYAKTSKLKSLIVEAVDERLDTLLRDCHTYHQSNFPLYQTAVVVRENLYALGIVNQIHRYMRDYRAEQDIFLLSDTNQFIHDIIGENDVPFIYEKTGSWYDHFLIDEFQDTSSLQWANFRPLIRNSLASGDPCLIVGDAKQSIYRWRGGDWSLIVEGVENDLGHDSLDYHVLDTNWRSMGKLIQFNNEIFKGLPGIFESYFRSLLKEEGIEQDEHMSRHFKALYQHARQSMADDSLKDMGMVEYKFIDYTQPAAEWKQAALVWLKEAIMELMDSGFNLSDMAILVRSKGEGREVVNFLTRNTGRHGEPFRVISNESLLIKDHPVIRFVTACFQLILRSHDQVAKEELKTALVDLELENSGNIREALQSNTLEKIVAGLQPLLSLDILEMYEQIIRKYALNDTPGAPAYLMAFKEAMMDYLLHHTSDLASFLTWWSEEAHKIAIQMPQNMDAIQVLTIHKSKGLEFGAVLLPFCNWEIDHSGGQDNFIWCQCYDPPFNKLGVVPVKYSGKLAKSLFSKDYFEEKHLAFIDNLNLAYVAFTRAREVLLACGTVTKSTKKNITGKYSRISDMIYHLMQHQEFEYSDHFDPDEQIFRLGSLPEYRVSENGESKMISIRGYRSGAWQQQIKIKQSSKEMFDDTLIEQQHNISFGILIHEILAQMVTADVDELEGILASYKCSGMINVEDERMLRQQLDRAFSNPEIAGLFDKKWQVKTEATLITQDKSVVRPDRVLFTDSEAIVVDFKSGKKSERDRSQVLGYKSILQEMGYKHVKAKVVYILQNEVVEV